MYCRGHTFAYVRAMHSHTFALLIHVLSWSHLCLKPPSMSHAQPYVRVAHTRRLYTKVWPRHYVPMPFSYITHTRTHAHTPTHTFPLYCISGTIGPIEPKFCMHMECDQTIKSHTNINLIWGHLGYANEGQRSNLPLFCISVTLGPIWAQILCAYGVWSGKHMS